MSKADIEFSKKLESSGQDYSEVTLRRIFTEAGLNSDLTERAIKDYFRYRESELSSLSILTGNEIRQLGAEAFVDKVIKLRKGVEIVEDILRDYLRYLNYKKEIAETYQESKDWGVVFSTSVYSDVKEAQESFIDYVEETYQTKVKDGKHLQKLTGITHLDSWDSKARKYITPDTEEEAKENAIRELEETIINSRYSKYFRALDKTLQEGSKYKDLLQIKPQDYGLPETWSGCLGSDQYSSILWAISFTYLINEPASLMMLPSLRAVAEEIEAPYSVLMDCYKLFNGGNNKKEDLKDKIKAVGQKVRFKFSDFIKSKGREWRRDWLLEDEPELYRGVLEDVKEDYVIGLTQVALKDITGREAKCGDEIESDIREYFKAELQEVNNLIQKK